MTDETNVKQPDNAVTVPFKAEIKQLLNILIHSLYTEREIFLRELISNASDALNRARFEMLTQHDVLDPDAELGIWVKSDPDQRLLTISDTGIGMTAEELAENLGTIAHSGVRAFLEAAQGDGKNLTEMIGQFGVGFYSVFMAAEWVRVTSRSYQKDAEAATWYATGADTYTIGPAQKEQRGTTVEIKLKEDAAEFAQVHRLRQAIHTHSDFIAFPIYLGEPPEQVNSQTALWRVSPREVKPEQYEEFYKQFTLFPDKPLLHVHVSTDAPVQVYALVYVPAKEEHSILALRKEDGLKLYSRKVLIQEYTKALLPEYFRFIQGVVDSEDLPLNVSRETVQSSPVIGRIKRILTSELIKSLKDLAQKDAEGYGKFWVQCGRYIKEGVTTDFGERANLLPLLRFHTDKVRDRWSSLADYAGRMKGEQKTIYYLLGDDERSVLRSPHLDYFQHEGLEVITLTEPIDAFMALELGEYEGYKFQNIASAEVESAKAEEKPAEEGETLPADERELLLERFQAQLGERVAGVRFSSRLSTSVARLVDPEGAMNQEMQRVYRMMERDYQVPKKILELNPLHPILKKLNELPADSDLGRAVVEQVFESALLIEGLHPDPASMIPRIQILIEAALKSGSE